MFYKKNVPVWERTLRAIVGGGLIVGGLLLKASPLGIALSVMGAAALATGTVGYCPACAMVGRKLK